MGASDRRLPELSPAPTDASPAVLDVGDGGSGTPFDWSLLAPRAPSATFIAGGVTPHNVSALLRYRPWGIDLSSGVERVPGEKDHGSLRLLFAAVAEGA
jgi:phosphoribosylanthranilate isomerase